MPSVFRRLRRTRTHASSSSEGGGTRPATLASSPYSSAAASPFATPATSLASFAPPSLSQQAYAYLLSAPPYSPLALAAALEFHFARPSPASLPSSSVSARASVQWRLHSSSSGGDVRAAPREEEHAGDFGCGAAPLAAWLDSWAQHVYARDWDAHMLQLAHGTRDMDCAMRASVGLPKGEAVWDIAHGTFAEPNLPRALTFLTLGSCAHYLAWHEPLATYNVFYRHLRPHGTLLLIGHRPVPGPYEGAMGEQTAPLRTALEHAPFTEPLAPFYSEAARLGHRDMYSTIPTPRQAGAAGWQPTVRYLTVNAPPEWSGPRGEDLTCLEAEELRATSPRAMAHWLRTTTGYVAYLRANPQEKARAAVDEDHAGLLMKAACAEGGLDYDDKLELRMFCAALLMRRDASSAPAPP